jgi:hypothetical protein
MEFGEVIPEKILIQINSGKDFSSETRATEVACHELGHALGLYGHFTGNPGTHLMESPTPNLLQTGLDNAIHPDERRAVRAIRYLPQGLDMNRFIMN